MGGIRVEQPLYMGGKIRAAYRMSVLGKEMAEMNEALTATEVILKTDKAYALVVKAQEMKKVADKYNAVLRELLSNVESAYKHGLKPQNDVLKVQVKLNESELSIRKERPAVGDYESLPSDRETACLRYPYFRQLSGGRKGDGCPGFRYQCPSRICHLG